MLDGRVIGVCLKWINVTVAELIVRVFWIPPQYSSDRDLKLLVQGVPI